ncbi:MAG: thiol:disulfide interchange protein DsbA/DsbL [Burkholderia sp.]|nr:thiol:disulfide interchange protein DsbA/DsbL [Burkholderia sp.]
MKKYINALLLSLYFVASGFAHAETPVSTPFLHTPVAGKDYMVIKNPKLIYPPTGKIEVIEFFWYGCPYCNKFEPILKNWIKKQGNKINFKRIPVAFGKKFVSHSRLFYTLDNLGLSEKFTPVIFNEIHNKKNYLSKQQDQVDFLERQGIDKKEFINIYNSSDVENKIKKSIEIIKAYEIITVPTVIISGKYKTGPSYTKSLIDTTVVLNHLIKQIEDEKNKSTNIK